MKKHLYFVCPTDHLELLIARTSDEETYFLTSLGNTMTFGKPLMREIHSLVEKKQLSEITFVLSDNNRIISDALKNKHLRNTRGMRNLYKEISRQKKLTAHVWQASANVPSVISYYLNTKIGELQGQLLKDYGKQVKINAKIYKRQERRFSAIHTALFSKSYFSLN